MRPSSVAVLTEAPATTQRLGSPSANMPTKLERGRPQTRSFLVISCALILADDLQSERNPGCVVESRGSTSHARGSYLIS